MKIMIATDSWAPLVNGVTVTLTKTVEQLRILGHQVHVINPSMFMTVAAPTYPDIRLSLFPYRKVRTEMELFDPDHIHIATEGPLGWAARKYCLKAGRQFTTSYHTSFPEYIQMRFKIPEWITWKLIERFHRPASRILVSTQTMQDLLAEHDLVQTSIWSRGVDLGEPEPVLEDLGEHPRFVYVGRLSVEKNLDAFLDATINGGTHIVVGDGPDRKRLERKYPGAKFLGYRRPGEIRTILEQSDCFVFPSRTDTFGIVLIEAMKCGLPVAAFRCPGPQDIIEHTKTGYLVTQDEDLDVAMSFNTLRINGHDQKLREACRQEGTRYTWVAATQQFLGAFPETLDNSKMFP